MRLAYADPPYPGCAWRYPEGDEVDPADLVAYLVAQFDGWALSTSSPALAEVLACCPAGVRVAAWVKPFAAFKANVRIAYAWEPVVFVPGRDRSADGAPVGRDWLAEPITLRRGLVGAKPARFCRWVLDLLGYREGDDLVDLYPGTGVMSRVAAQGLLL